MAEKAKKQEKKKIKVLAYMDSPVVQTGFGRVSREILTRLQATKKFDIVVVGLNDRGEYHEQRNNFKIVPCPDLKDDPYGHGELVRTIQKENPDVIFAMNDIWVFTGFEENKNKNWFANLIDNVAPGTPVVCYFTVDGHPNAPEWDDFIRWLTVPVIMSDYAKQTISETAPDVVDSLMTAYHGSSVDYFYPLSEKDKLAARHELSRGAVKPEDFLITVVSRNQPRKNLPTLLHAFKKFNEGYHICPECKYPNSDVDRFCEICGASRNEVEKGEYVTGVGNAFLYLHMAIRDMRGFKLDKIIGDNKIQHVLFRPRHDIAQGVEIEDLNRIYNASTVFCQPTYAEGYGLPPIEAACAGTPVIATRTTTMIEMFENGRGELVRPDSVMVLADAGHCRKHNISEVELIKSFQKLYNDSELREQYSQKGREFALTRTWDGASKVMTKAIVEASKRTVYLHTHYSDKPGPKYLIVNGDNNPENILHEIPLLKGLSRKNENTEIVCVSEDRAATLLDGLDFVTASFGTRYSKANKETMQKKGIMVINLSNIWDAYQKAVFPNTTVTADQLYCSKYGIESDRKFRFRPTLEEKKKVQKLFGKKKRTRIFIGTAGLPEHIYPFGHWTKLLEFLSAQDKTIEVYTDMTSHNPEKHKSIKCISTFPLREQLVIAKYCDIVVSCENIFLMLGEYFDGIKIGISAGQDLKKKYDYADFTEISRGGKEFECWPCTRINGVPCRKNNKAKSECAMHIRPEEIVGVILKAMKKREGEK